MTGRAHFQRQVAFFYIYYDSLLPSDLLHPASATGVIVLTPSVFLCVCVCVCLLPLSRENGQIYGPDFWYAGIVEEYLGQVQRSRS